MLVIAITEISTMLKTAATTVIGRFIAKAIIHIKSLYP